MTTDQTPEVTQADRKAAISLHGSGWMTNLDDLAEAFACHRIASVEAAIREKGQSHLRRELFANALFDVEAERDQLREALAYMLRAYEYESEAEDTLLMVREGATVFSVASARALLSQPVSKADELGGDHAD